MTNQELSDCDRSLLTQEKLNLKSWSLPRAILEKYAAKGVEAMFPWQVECLTCEGVLSGRNLVYSAPTSAGKTMVAEILAIQTVLERKKKVIIILPFISVVREKMLYFQNLLGGCGVRVEGFMGSHAPPGGLRTVHVAICTIEKANSLINRLLEDQGLDSVGCVVVDEIHLLGDPARGYLLELLLTKLKYMSLRDQSVRLQIVGMSATLPNMGELARWLDAALYTTDFRPIPLREHYLVDSGVYDAPTLQLRYTMQPLVKFKSDPGNMFHLCFESLLAGHSALVFCPTRAWCERCSQQISAEFRRIGYEGGDAGLKVRDQLDGNALADVIEQLKRCPAGLDPALGRSIAFGVAFHHAGLTMDERDIVEGAFRTSVVRVLVATSTLSSGVNLPARRVVIRCPPRNGPADVLTYRQMVGRAGRMGKDTLGESFLVCNGSERRQAEELVGAELPPVESSLGGGDLTNSLKRAVLEVIASGVVKSQADVEAYTGCTFLASCSEDEDNQLADPIAACVEYLQTNEFIRVSESVLGATPLAEACLSASLPPDQGLKLLKELHRARQCFVLETELHVIYQVTPYSVCDQWGQLDWLRVLSLWEDLPIGMKRVGELVGVEERFLVKAVRGTVNPNTHAQKLSIHRRFYTALALQDLVNEVPLPQVARKFDCSKGLLQSLQQSASTFAGMVTQFSRRLGWSNIELLVGQFVARLQFGAQRELLDLLRLDCITALQARALYTAGVQVLADLATASPGKIERALARAKPFQSENEECESSAKCRVWLVGRCATTEAHAAGILIREARLYLERELGLQSANWGDLNISTNNTISDTSLTQSLDTPLRPIGADLASNKGDDCKKTAVGTSENSASNKIQNIKSEVNEPKEENNPKNNSEPHPCKEEETNGELEDVNVCNERKSELAKKEVDGTKGFSVAISDKLECLKSVSEDQSKRKRGSLDLFDSPDKAEISKEFDSSGTNIEEKNLKISETFLESVTTSNSNHPIAKLSIGMEIGALDFDKKNNEPDIFVLNINATKTMPTTAQNTSNSVIDNRSIFFDSPLPNELIQTRKSCLLEEFDANIGGDSLLEMSLAVGGLKEQHFPDLEESFLLDANIGGDSLIETSVILAGSEGKKRKRNLEESFISKRLRVNSSDGEKAELQVSQISSTIVNLRPKKTSTPTCSKYFEDSFLFDSPMFSDCGLLGNARENIDIPLNISLNNIHPTSVEGNAAGYCENSDKEPSFELVLSHENSASNSFCDNSFNLDSKVCDLLNCKDSKGMSDNQNQPENSLHEDKVVVKSCDESCPFDASINLDSKLEAVLDAKTGNIDSKKVFHEELTDKKYQKLDRELNGLGTNTSVISALNALIDGRPGQNISGNISQLNSFYSNLNLNTQLCGLLDGQNSEHKDCFKKPTISLHQTDVESANDSHPVHILGNKASVSKRLWTESMEVNEIQNLSLDDDTVFGTPVAKYRSVSFMRSQKSRICLEESNLRECDIETSAVRNKASSNEPSTSAGINRVSNDLRCVKQANEINNSQKLLKEESCKRSTVKSKIDISQMEMERGNHLLENSDSKYNSSNMCENQNNQRIAAVTSMTNTFLEAALADPFVSELVINDDEIMASQKSPETPHKSLRERIRNVNSPSPNHRLKVEVVHLSDPKTTEEFRRNLAGKKSISLALNVVSCEEVDSGGGIAANIVRKRTANRYPCGHHGSTLKEVSVYWGDNKVYLLSMDHANCASNVSVLRELLSRSDLLFCSWQVKHVTRLLRQCCQLTCRATASDPAIAQWMLKPQDQLTSLKQLARQYEVSPPQCTSEAGFEAALVWKLTRLLKAKLKQANLFAAYTDVEMPTQLLLSEMEVTGVKWDRDYVQLLWANVDDKMTELQDRLYGLVGRKLNIRSRTDLAKVKILLKASGEEALDNFEKILHHWRVLNSLKTRNMSPLLMSEGDLVAGSWETHTVTGRISMQEPSLQHVPRDFTIDDQLFSLRSAFTAAPGHSLVSADFCQLELRLLAHFSQDPGLLQSFSRPGDVFKAIAAEWNNIPVQQVTDEVRNHAKQLCYGLVYGMGLRSLAEQLGVGEPRAADMADGFHGTYPGLRTYASRCIAECRATGAVGTINGRKRALPNISSQNNSLRGQAERQAVNTTIQGSAADIAKTAMLRVERTRWELGLNARLIIHLHDELIYEVEDKDVPEFVKVIRRDMEGAVALSIPLPVKVKKGPSWGQLEET